MAVAKKVEKADKVENKKFQFRSINKTLFIGELNIDFVDGFYETDNEKVAQYLEKVYGVERVGE